MLSYFLLIFIYTFPDVFASSSLKYRIQRARKKNKTKQGKRNKNLKRREKSLYFTLIPELRSDPGEFFEYLRMSVDTFDYIHRKLEEVYRSHFRKPIVSTGERLCVTIR